MISITDLAMQYGQKTLFENASLNFDPGKRYGLVGANGSGTVSYTHLTLPTILLV